MMAEPWEKMRSKIDSINGLFKYSEAAFYNGHNKYFVHRFTPLDKSKYETRVELPLVSSNDFDTAYNMALFQATQAVKRISTEQLVTA